MLGKPAPAVMPDMAVAVDDGYAMVWDIGYDWPNELGGSMEPCVCAGDMVEYALLALCGMDIVDGVCGVVGVWPLLPGCAKDSEPNCPPFWPCSGGRVVCDESC